MQGAGNDYVYVDCFKETVDSDLANLARRVSDRRFGIGADGLILIHPSERADARMQMFNADGSEAQMCGNGLRCVAKYVYDHGICRREKLSIETGAGVLSAWIETQGSTASRVRTDLGQPILAASQIPTSLAEESCIDVPLEVAGITLNVTCVSFANPHCVVFVEQATDELVLEVGPQIELHPAFPQRTNVEFAEVLSPTEIRQRTWERGSGETWACGTGAAAVCVAGVLTGRTQRKTTIQLLGGPLETEWNADDDRVYLTGPATEVFTGEWRE